MSENFEAWYICLHKRGANFKTIAAPRNDATKQASERARWNVCAQLGIQNCEMAHLTSSFLPGRRTRAGLAINLSSLLVDKQEGEHDGLGQEGTKEELYNPEEFGRFTMQNSPRPEKRDKREGGENKRVC